MAKLSKEEMAELKALRAKRSKTNTGLENYGKQSETNPVDPNAPSMLESAGRGVAQGASFGFADEISGGVKGVFKKLRGDEGSTFDLIQKSILSNRKADDAAREANPATFGAAEFASGIAKDMLIPGGAALRGAGLAKNALAASGLGAIEALGRADGESLTTEAVLGGLLGGGGAIGTNLVGKSLKKLGTLGRKKLGEMGVTGKILGGKKPSEAEDIYLRLTTQGQRNVTSRSEREFKKQALAFEKANRLYEKATGKTFVTKTGNGFGVEITAEMDQQGSIRKALRAQRSRTSGSTPNDLSILDDQMEARTIALSNKKNAILNMAGEKLKNKRFGVKNLGIKDALDDISEFTLSQPKGSKIRKIMKSDKKDLSFSEIGELERYVSDALKRSWKDPIDSGVEKSLKNLRKSLVATQRDQVRRVMGEGVGSANNDTFEELSALITSREEIFKARNALFRLGSAEAGKLGEGVLERAAEVGGESMTNQGLPRAGGILKKAAQGIQAVVQAPTDMAGRTLSDNTAFIGSSEAAMKLTESLFPMGTLDEGGEDVSLSDGMEKRVAQSYIDQLPPRQRAAEGLKLKKTGKFSLKHIPKQLKEKYIPEAQAGF